MDGGSTSGDGRVGGGTVGLGFGVALPGEEVLRKLISTGLLTEYERAEIRDTTHVYWAGETASKPRATLLPGELNHGFDDDKGDYHVTMHDHIGYRYEVLGLVGKGAFGQVVRAFDHLEQRTVAIKVIRNKKRYHKQALVEASVLRTIAERDPRDECNCVRLLEHLSFRGHLCIVTELLSMSLYDFLKANCFLGVSLPLIRRFAVQLLNSLRFLQKHDIVHCDLKPENVLLSTPGRSALKLIDFGSACFEAQPVYSYIQSRFYRSPEVLLGRPYFCAIDMWSLGCVLAELFTGNPLFPGESELDQLACMMEVLGAPPSQFATECSRRKTFFAESGAPRLVTTAKGVKRRPGSSDIMAALRCTDTGFVSFLEGCLRWDAASRFTPDEALRHEWILAGQPPPLGFGGGSGGQPSSSAASSTSPRGSYAAAADPRPRSSVGSSRNGSARGAAPSPRGAAPSPRGVAAGGGAGLSLRPRGADGAAREMKAMAIGASTMGSSRVAEAVATSASSPRELAALHTPARELVLWPPASCRAAAPLAAGATAASATD